MAHKNNVNCDCGPSVPSEFYQIERNITLINNNPPYPDPDGSGYWMIYNPRKKKYELSDVAVPVYTGGVDVDVVSGGDSTDFATGVTDKTLTAHILARSDTEVNWQANNPVLENGEFALTTDGENKGRFKIGDGVSAWADLAYYGGGEVSGDYVTKQQLENGDIAVNINSLVQDDGDVLILDGGSAPLELEGGA